MVMAPDEIAALCERHPNIEALEISAESD